MLSVSSIRGLFVSGGLVFLPPAVGFVRRRRLDFFVFSFCLILKPSRSVRNGTSLLEHTFFFIVVAPGTKTNSHSQIVLLGASDNLRGAATV